ncbi:MAG TPA: WlaTC/HtrL family glycosyltransferase [Gemmatimonadaceae bacterium]|nr:WlaTC/HtrL family glycosyltransferase [Gemmatimonadaceae bacterium]
MADLTVVTGIWDLDRAHAGNGFARPFSHYTERFAQLLAADIPMVVFGDESLRPFVRDARGGRPTDFRVRPASHFRTHFDFHARVQEIRTSDTWLAQAEWLRESPQATLELYNPMVMSKMFMLHDASLWNPFGTKHFAWIDGAITNTVSPGYFTHDRVFDKVEQFLGTFFFVSFPYTGGGEVHGFGRAGMRTYCGVDPAYVCRGGFFGGHRDCLSEVNEHYYGLLSASLHGGWMGTEESVFTIMAHEEPGLYARYALREEHGGLLAHFFEHVKRAPALAPAPRAAPVTGPAKARPRRTAVPDVSDKTVAGYVVTFNAPDQLAALLESWTRSFRFDALYVLDNSTDDAARAANALVAAPFGATMLAHPKGNGGICGGRQFVAEHFDASPYDYCVFLEDDMFLNAASDTGVCRNGFRRSIPNLREVLLRIMGREGFDFLKLSFTELYGDNGTQWAWYNVPQGFRSSRWPEKPDLPVHGLDPEAPLTNFGTIGAVDGVAYADGEVYYSNWPQIVSRAGNRRMFLDTVWRHPYEQTWMSHMYQLTLKGALRPAVLLASIVTHDRFHHYDAGLRREN